VLITFKTTYKHDGLRVASVTSLSYRFYAFGETCIPADGLRQDSFSQGLSGSTRSPEVTRYMLLSDRCRLRSSSYIYVAAGPRGRLFGRVVPATHFHESARLIRCSTLQYYTNCPPHTICHMPSSSTPALSHIPTPTTTSKRPSPPSTLPLRRLLQQRHAVFLALAAPQPRPNLIHQRHLRTPLFLRQTCHSRLGPDSRSALLARATQMCLHAETVQGRISNDAIAARRPARQACPAIPDLHTPVLHPAFGANPP
jgi:hypothetical protein